MVTALSVYGSNTASTTLATANKLFSATGATSTTSATKCGSLTGWSEIFAQGTANAWQALGSMGSPSGNGWLFDVTTLEGQQIIAGTWNASCKLDTPGASGLVTITLSMNVYKRTSGGVYTLIGSLTLTGQALQSTLMVYNMGAASLSAMNFPNTGDKLYCDLWGNITANTAGSTQNMNCQIASSTTQGVANNAEWDSPGYQVIPSGAVHFRISDGYGGVFS